MSTVTVLTETDAAAPLMAAAMEEELSRQRGGPVRVRGIEHVSGKMGSSFHAERLRVSLDRGRPLDVFFKDLNPANQSATAKAVRPVDLEPGLRELTMYQKILSPEQTGTLRLYGYRWEPADGRYWVFLEFGGPTLLRNTSDLRRWIIAARWAGRFHALTRELDPEKTRFLPRFDRAHYERCAQRVADVIPGLTSGQRNLVTRGLERFRAAIDRLAALPGCVIHGQFFGQNVLLRRRLGVLRAVPIDWETAAVGPGAFDLVSITSGKWTPPQRLAMQTAYFEEFHAVLPDVLTWSALLEELRIVGLYQALEWIAWWGHHPRLSKDFTRFLNELSAVLA